MFLGGMTRELFAEFLNNTAQHMDNEETHYLLYNGAPAHRGAADLTDDIHVKMLPPYSPFLDPVEQAIITYQHQGRHIPSSHSNSYE